MIAAKNMCVVKVWPAFVWSEDNCGCFIMKAAGLTGECKVKGLGHMNCDHFALPELHHTSW